MQIFYLIIYLFALPIWIHNSKWKRWSDARGKAFSRFYMSLALFVCGSIATKLFLLVSINFAHAACFFLALLSSLVWLEASWMILESWAHCRWSKSFLLEHHKELPCHAIETKKKKSKTTPAGEAFMIFVSSHSALVTARHFRSVTKPPITPNDSRDTKKNSLRHVTFSSSVCTFNDTVGAFQHDEKLPWKHFHAQKICFNLPT